MHHILSSQICREREHMDSVQVYQFEKFDINSGEYKLSPRMALASTIEGIEGARMIRGQGLRVDPKWLDGNGCLREKQPD